MFFNFSSTLSSKPPLQWTVSVKRMSSHLGNHTVFNELVNRRLWKLILIDSSEAGCESQQSQFANVPLLPTFELQCLELHTTLETHEI